MNETFQSVPPAAAAGKTPPPVAVKPAAPAVAVVAPASQPPAAFGGHRGGGKKRLDGLPAGSPEAIEADKAKDRERKRLANEKKKVASLPPPLPGISPPAVNAAPAVVAGASVVPAVAASAAPLFVPWSQKLLEKPARLLTKIGDRFRCWSLARKIRRLNLDAEAEKEILSDLAYKEEVTADFSAALAECATVELNKRRIGGAENSHWVNLAMTGGELVAVHLQSLDRLEKMLLEKQKAEKQKAAEAAKK